MIKRVLWIVIPLALLGGLYAVSRARPVPVDVVDVTRGGIRKFVEEEGKTRVIERYVVSATVSGRLERVALEAGDEVGPGDVVAKLDPLPLHTAIVETEAQIRGLRQQMAGVDTKKPKAGEIERARVLEEQARDALQVAERELDRAEATWDRMKKDLARAQSLSAKELITIADLDAAVATEAEAHEHVRAQEVRIKMANLAISATGLNRTILESRMNDFDWEAKAYEQQIEALEATIGKLKDDESRTRITAPIGGVVLRVLQESEQAVQAGTPILEIGDLRHLEVEADFLSEDVAHMRLGMTAEVFGRALGDRVIPGKISRIHPSAFEKISSLGVEQQRVKVLVAFDATDAGLGDLFRVEVRVILEEREDVILVPEGALFRHRSAWQVFLVRDEMAVLRKVETGIRDGRYREVLAGLEAGETLVVHPGDAVTEGARVKALPPPSSTSLRLARAGRDHRNWRRRARGP